MVSAVEKNLEITIEKMNEPGRIRSKAHIKRHNNAFEFMKRYIKDYKEEPVLDIGCRDGHILEILQSNEYRDLSGIDIIPNPLKLLKGISYYKCDASDMSMFFHDETFSVVILSHVLEHIEEPEKVLNDIYRILKPNGILFIEIPLESETKPEVGHFSYFKKPKHLYKLMEDKFELLETYKDIKQKEALITRIWLRVVAKKV